MTSGTKSGTFKWQATRFEPKWADTPEDVTEWDRRENPGCDIYPRLVVATDLKLGFCSFTMPAKTQKDNKGLIEAVRKLYYLAQRKNARSPGSNLRNRIIELATTYTPVISYSVRESPEQRRHPSLGLDNWIMAAYFVHVYLRLFEELANRPPKEFARWVYSNSKKRHPISRVPNFIKDDEEIFDEVLVEAREQHGLEGTIWLHLNNAIEKCETRKQIRGVINSHLEHEFLREKPSIILLTTNDGPQLFCETALLPWLSHQLANYAMGKYVRTCQGCGELFHSTRPHTKSCGGRCRKRLQRP
jgi:hypothetical protein